MEHRVVLICNEYRHNIKFKQYVDKYARHNGIAVAEALRHEIVRQAALYYTEV